MHPRAVFKHASLALGLVACSVGAAQAQSPAQALLTDSWTVNLGAFVVGSGLTASLNGRSVSNPEVDFDEVFGSGSDATRWRADVLWRITPAHHLRFLYFDNTLDRSRVIDQALHWGDYVFDVGGKVDLQQKQRTTELVYEYAFMRDPSYELSASLGVHYSDLSLKLSGNATVTDVNGNTSHISGATKASSVPVPLPVLGLRLGWAVAPQWYVDAQAQYLALQYDQYDGHWSDLRLGATWMYSRNFGVGLGYNRFATSVAVTKDSFDGKVKTHYSGLQLYLTGSF